MISTENIQNEIIENFKVLDNDFEMTLNYLMEIGEKLDVLDEKYKSEENLVKGCQSMVWLTHKIQENKGEKKWPKWSWRLGLAPLEYCSL